MRSDVSICIYLLAVAPVVFFQSVMVGDVRTYSVNVQSPRATDRALAIGSRHSRHISNFLALFRHLGSSVTFRRHESYIRRCDNHRFYMVNSYLRFGAEYCPNLQCLAVQEVSVQPPPPFFFPPTNFQQHHVQIPSTEFSTISDKCGKYGQKFIHTPQ
jgi:hypothetical protein